MMVEDVAHGHLVHHFSSCRYDLLPVTIACPDLGLFFTYAFCFSFLKLSDYPCLDPIIILSFEKVS